jgi:hypothetical protein
MFRFFGSKFRTIHKKSVFILIASFALLVSQANSQTTAPRNSFSGRVKTESATTSNTAQNASLSRVVLNPVAVTGGSSATARIVLTQAAPSGGARVLLTSANPRIVSSPASVTIPYGHTGASVQLTTSIVTAVRSVTITASYNNSVAGATLTVNPQTTPQFAIVTNPKSVSVDQGSSGTVQIVTTAKTGFDHSLMLNVANAPQNVSVSLNPSLIAAPGTGTAQATVSVGSNVAAGNYTVKISATDGSTTHSASINLTVGGSQGPVGSLKGCMYHQNGDSYQGVDITMNRAATVNFDAVLYHGPSCDPNQWADEFGFGNPINLGGFGYTFWFSDFKDQPNTSAIWTVGNQKSQCVDYTTVPSC